MEVVGLIWLLCAVTVAFWIAEHHRKRQTPIPPIPFAFFLVFSPVIMLAALTLAIGRRL